MAIVTQSVTGPIRAFADNTAEDRTVITASPSGAGLAVPHIVLESAEERRSLMNQLVELDRPTWRTGRPSLDVIDKVRAAMRDAAPRASRFMLAAALGVLEAGGGTTTNLDDEDLMDEYDLGRALGAVLAGGVDHDPDNAGHGDERQRLVQALYKPGDVPGVASMDGATLYDAVVGRGLAFAIAAERVTETGEVAGLLDALARNAEENERQKRRESEHCSSDDGSDEEAALKHAVKLSTFVEIMRATWKAMDR